MREISVGDYVLSGGETAALVLLDACVRLLPGVMGAAACLTALWNRDRPGGSGRGDVIDLSLYGSLTFTFGMFVAEHEVSGVMPTRRGNRLGNAPRNAWQ